MLIIYMQKGGAPNAHRAKFWWETNGRCYKRVNNKTTQLNRTKCDEVMNNSSYIRIDKAFSSYSQTEIDTIIGYTGKNSKLSTRKGREVVSGVIAPKGRIIARTHKRMMQDGPDIVEREVIVRDAGRSPLTSGKMSRSHGYEKLLGNFGNSELKMDFSDTVRGFKLEVHAISPNETLMYESRPPVAQELNEVVYKPVKITLSSTIDGADFDKTFHKIGGNWTAKELLDKIYQFEKIVRPMSDYEGTGEVDQSHVFFEGLSRRVKGKDGKFSVGWGS